MSTLICWEDGSQIRTYLGLWYFVFLAVFRIACSASNSLLFAAVFRKRDYYGINAYLFLNNSFVAMLGSGLKAVGYAMDTWGTFYAFGPAAGWIKRCVQMAASALSINFYIGIVLFGLDRIWIVFKTAKQLPNLEEVVLEKRARFIVYILGAAVFGVSPAIFVSSQRKQKSSNETCSATSADLVQGTYRLGLILTCFLIFALLSWANRKSSWILRQIEKAPGEYSLEVRVRVRQMESCTRALSTIILSTSILLVPSMFAYVIYHILSEIVHSDYHLALVLTLKVAGAVSQNLMMLLHGIIGYVKMRGISHHSTWLKMIKIDGRVSPADGDFHMENLKKMWKVTVQKNKES